VKQPLIILAFNIVLSGFLHVEAQTKELHIKLSLCHQKAMEYAMIIKDSNLTNYAVLNNRYDEVRMAYKDAIIQRIELRKALLKSDQIKAYDKSIEMHHMEAYHHYIDLGSELTKDNCNKSDVKKYAENFYKEINKAEIAHLELQNKLNK
jgi:hypothetical protein